MTKQEFEEYYRIMRPKIRFYMMSHVNNPENAEDLTEDVFMRALEKLPSYDESVAAFSTWIYTIARNRLTDFYRRNRISDELTENIPDERDILDGIIAGNTFERMKKAITLLNERERTVILLRYYKNFSLKTIAEKMGISYSYTKVIHKNALNALQIYIEQ